MDEDKKIKLESELGRINIDILVLREQAEAELRQKITVKEKRAAEIINLLRGKQPPAEN